MVVGVFDAARSGFDSEIWGDVDQLMQAFRRPVYSSLIFRLNDSGQFAAVQAAIEGDQRLTLEAKRETQFYADQSEALSTFIRILGLSLSVIFSIGAVIGAMITMYAAVASRTAEIGTLRALGFRQRSILTAFLLESLFLSLLGGLIGLFLALIDLPDFLNPLRRIAGSVDKLAGVPPEPEESDIRAAGAAHGAEGADAATVPAARSEVQDHA